MGRWLWATVRERAGSGQRATGSGWAGREQNGGRELGWVKRARGGRIEGDSRYPLHGVAAGEIPVTAASGTCTDLGSPGAVFLGVVGAAQSGGWRSPAVVFLFFQLACPPRPDDGLFYLPPLFSPLPRFQTTGHNDLRTMLLALCREHQSPTWPPGPLTAEAACPAPLPALWLLRFRSRCNPSLNSFPPPSPSLNDLHFFPWFYLETPWARRPTEIR